MLCEQNTKKISTQPDKLKTKTNSLFLSLYTKLAKVGWVGKKALKRLKKMTKIANNQTRAVSVVGFKSSAS